MKIFFTILIALCVINTFGQARFVAQEIKSATNHQKFEKFNLLTADTYSKAKQKYHKELSDVTILKVDESQFSRLLNTKPAYLEMSVPYKNQNLKIKLIQQNILTNSFVAKDEKGNVINYKPGIYYKGIIDGNENSIVGISFFENDIIGIVSSPELGNIVIGQSKDKQNYLTYNDQNLKRSNPFACGVDESTESHYVENLNFIPQSTSKTTLTDNCVRIYYEVGYSTYQDNDSDETNCLNWLTGVFNNVNTLYQNDGLKISMNEVKIWTTPDPYTSTDHQENLFEFKENTPDFNGDLASFIATPAATSYAFLNSFCSDFNYNFCGVEIYYETVPTFSWTIEAITHETGHSFGSPHTHACAWNGNNTAIDGCGPEAGASEGCEGPIPSEGGTIMSYCHLSWVGINLSLGFGPQPSELIRNTVESKLCLGTDCVTTCEPTVDKVNYKYLTNTSIEVHITDDVSDSWEYKVYPIGNPDAGTWQTTTSKIFTIDNIADGYQEFILGNKCENGIFGITFTRLTLGGDLCGEKFVDTGGEEGMYADNETILKTFYPQLAGEKVSLTFTAFDLEADYDFMYIYNGNSTDAPLFTNGNELSGNTIPGPFTSTSSDGTITVKFVSDSGAHKDGWVANVDCGQMATNDVNLNNEISIYPNPSKEQLHIDAKEKIQSVRINDASGKNVLRKSTDAKNVELNIKHLPKGMYIVTIEINEKSVSKKIVKE